VHSLSYEIVDVFTDRPFTGNPLAVVFGADDLSGDQLQALAREFNLSETAFVVPATDPAATYRLRIFTPDSELPFAGHPSVGTALTLVRLGRFPAGELVQQCGAGLVRILVDGVGKARLTGANPTVSGPLAVEPVLASVGLSLADHVGPPPRVAGCGLEFVYLSVRPEALAQASGDPVAARAAGISQVSVFGWSPDPAQAHARVFCPGVGVPEDPATGSAALGLGVWLVTSGLLPGDGESAYTVWQGAEMHRPSTLECTVTAVDGTAIRSTVAGHAVPVAAGQITVPPFVG
jgi:trans-2,3-dihydro-3-hydroxyanthranilate isomerase